MQDQTIDVVGVGNAIVDVLAQASDDFIISQGLAKGSMALIDEDRAHELYALMNAGIEASGGSAANTMAGIASFGGTATYVGKVRDDQLGEVFAHDMRAIGVGFDIPLATAGPATGRSLILVTPDAERTMNTFLGMSSMMEPADIPVDTVKKGSLLFCEGYLWDMDSAKAAIRKAMEIAGSAGRRVALTVSDTFCVERHQQEFLDLIAGPVEVLFANEAEVGTLYECDFETAVERVRANVELGCLTRGEAGSLIVTADDTIEIKAEPVANVVDTTGAGDQYAAGVLYGLARNLPLAEAGRLGSLAASEVISHYGPRPQTPLSDLL